MGYDMLTECSLESILASEKKDVKDENIQIQNRVEVKFLIILKKTEEKRRNNNGTTMQTSELPEYKS